MLLHLEFVWLFGVSSCLDGVGDAELNCAVSDAELHCAVSDAELYCTVSAGMEKGRKLDQVNDHSCHGVA